MKDIINYLTKGVENKKEITNSLLLNLFRSILKKYKNEVVIEYSFHLVISIQRHNPGFIIQVRFIQSFNKTPHQTGECIIILMFESNKQI